MAGSDTKGAAKIGDSIQGVRVTNGRVHVRFVTRTLPGAEGYGSSQIKAGVASKGQVEVINGALKVRLN